MIPPNVRVTLNETTPQLHSIQIFVENILNHESVSDQADAIGLPGIRNAIADECRALGPVCDYAILNQQITNAQERVKQANKQFSEVTAAKILLERKPEPGLAEKLTAIASEIVQAQAEKEAAGKELEVLLPLRARHYLPAVNAIVGQVTARVMNHAIELDKRTKQYQETVNTVCASVALLISQMIAKMVTQYVAPHLPELCKLKLANSVAWSHKGQTGILDSILTELTGDLPDDCQRYGNDFSLKPKPREVPPANVVHPMRRSLRG